MCVVVIHVYVYKKIRFWIWRDVLFFLEYLLFRPVYDFRKGKVFYRVDDKTSSIRDLDFDQQSPRTNSTPWEPKDIRCQKLKKSHPVIRTYNIRI